MGVFGCGLFIAIFASAWSAAGRLYRESTEPMIRADAAAIQVALSLFVFHFFYTSAQLENPAFQIVFAALLGYLAWLYRRHSRVDTADPLKGGMHKYHQNSTLPVKRKKANPFRQKTKPIIRHYQNSVFSLSMSIADAKSSGLLRMFIGASTSITR